MNIQLEISKLVDKSNKEYLQRFIHFAALHKITDIQKAFSLFGKDVCKPKTKCLYMFKRGINNGKQCSVIATDEYCSKHKKHASVEKTNEEVLKLDLENISDEELEDDIEEIIDEPEEEEDASDDASFVSDNYDNDGVDSEVDEYF